MPINVANPGGSTSSLRAAFDSLLGTGRTLPFFGVDYRNWSRPALAGFPTIINETLEGNAAIFADHPNGGPLSIVAKTCAQVYSMTALMKNAPTPPWTIECAVSAQCDSQGNNAQFIPLLCQSTDGKLCGIWWGADARAWMESTNNAIPGTLPNDNLDLNLQGFSFNDYLAYFRLTHTGTELIPEISPNGIDWDTLYADAAAALTFMGDVSKVGFGLERGSIGNAFFTMRIKLWNWVES